VAPVEDEVSMASKTEEPKKKRGRPPAPGLSRMQGEVLGHLLAGRPIEVIREVCGISKQRVFELVNELRRRGLITDPETVRTSMLAKAQPADTQLAWWKTEAGSPGVWQVLRVTLPHQISAGRLRNMASDRSMLVFIAPGGVARVGVFSTRLRVSYEQVASVMGALTDDPRTLRRATEAVARLTAQEAVLPAWFVEEPTEEST
jgi:hypothetical protein